jgi:ring-1,2-phenylacetyl-CoA epoxidase subunit PaaD
VAAVTVDQVWQALGEVMDPEIPVLSLVELGVIRDVELHGDGVTVAMTPTFAGCPAWPMMKAEVGARLRVLGLAEVTIREQLFPPWTTEWLSEESRLKLATFGLAPPPRHRGDLELVLTVRATCPNCGSDDTVVTNPFGATPCRTLYVCRRCSEPFEQFKPL